MSYDPTTDFFALLRQTPGGVRSLRVPGLDVAISALARAGFITLFVGQSAPTTNPTTTVWLKPAVPSWTAEGVVLLWDAGLEAFAPATPLLWSTLISGPFIELIPQPDDEAPKMDGNASVGVSPAFSRGDHVHPTDTSRAPLASPVFTGTPEAPTAPLGDDSTKLATTEFVIQNGGLPPPIGSVLPFAGATVPANWALANGAAFSRTGSTANLFSTIGITYGAGDGVTTANLPDLRGRTVAGADNMGGVAANRLTTATMSSQALAGVGGAETIVLTAAQIPTITSNVTTLTAATVGTNGGSNSFNVSGGSGSNLYTNPIIQQASASGSAVSNNTQGAAHPNVQPTMELNYIIRIS